MLIPPVANQSQSTSPYFAYSFFVQTASNTGTGEVFHFFFFSTMKYPYSFACLEFLPKHRWCVLVETRLILLQWQVQKQGWYSCNGKFRIALFDWSSCIFISSKDKWAEFGRLINNPFPYPPSAPGGELPCHYSDHTLHIFKKKHFSPQPISSPLFFLSSCFFFS